MEKTINCDECGISYTYEERAGYPRKYCGNCSQQKKNSFANVKTDVVPQQTIIEKPKEEPKARVQRTAEDITLGEDCKMAISMFNAMIDKGIETYDLMDKCTKLVKQAKEGLQ